MNSDQQPTIPLVLPRYADWLTTNQVAEAVGVSPVVVNNWIVIGLKTEAGRIRLKAVKVGGRWKIDPAAVTAFFEASTIAALPESATADAAPATPVRESEADEKRRIERCMESLRRRGVGLPSETEAARKRRGERCMAELREVYGVGLPDPPGARTRKNRDG